MTDGMVFADNIWVQWLEKFAKNGQIESCLLLLNKISRMDNGSKLKASHFNSILTAYGIRGDLDGLRSTLQYMNQMSTQPTALGNPNPLSPNAATYWSYIRSLLQMKRKLGTLIRNGEAFEENMEKKQALQRELDQIMSEMSSREFSLSWKLYTYLLEDMLCEGELTWDQIQTFIASVVAARKVFPRQPLTDAVVSAAIQLGELENGLLFIKDAFGNFKKKYVYIYIYIYFFF
ncbi:hypothetical protein RFI_09480 [Reticulomyxa filosa]|uniref:Pentatricopeptide repeat-containing protein n=1 Tax=Reticulomyxa filosa TaxID=46433 RepID=X6NN04_RETFI|nr:hypothetical protein RFI_09480 [Reticulomyxa filosa]|eukprot:ETO27650.1 hypothetical protein RFI_09480 [Reticulomyxa filosa]